MLPKPKVYLSPSELRIAQMSAKTDLSGQQMADKLFVDIKTLKFHLTNIYKKFGVKSRIELVQNFARKGEVFETLEAETDLYAAVPSPPEGLE